MRSQAVRRLLADAGVAMHKAIWSKKSLSAAWALEVKKTATEIERVGPGLKRFEPWSLGWPGPVCRGKIFHLCGLLVAAPEGPLSRALSPLPCPAFL